MEIFNELKPNHNVSLCLGFFDGVHQGHKVVLKNTVNIARQNGVKSAVLTFKEHPLCYLQNRNPQYILPLEDRLKLIEEQGIDYAYVLDFDENIADLLAGDYLKEILVDNFKPKFITTGFNHYFGANKQGDSNFLRRCQKLYGYKYFEIPPISFNNVLISSSKIRQFISSGNVENLENLLGQPFYVKGMVVKGNQIGRTLSYPTINLNYPDDIIKPSNGVYCATVEIDGEIYQAVANLGKRPTLGSNSNAKLLLEAHLFDFDKDVYGKNVKISFLRKLRDEQKFDSLSVLKSQLVKDENTAKEFFKAFV